MDDLPDSDFREADRLASLVVNYSRANWNINLSANYAGERSMQVGVEELEIDDYWLLNFKSTFSVSRKVQWYLTGRNILNESYGSPNRLTLHTEPAPNRGRELILGVEYRF